MSLLTKYQQVTDHSGLDWYRESNEWCKRVADKHTISLVTVCAVVSALSPACNWERNKRDALALITKKHGYKYVTYGRNIDKAHQILRSGTPLLLNEKTGIKTFNFFHNLLEPENPTFITIDRHGYKIADVDLSGLINLSISQRNSVYHQTAERYIKASKKLGLLPNELQAVLWVDYRKKENIKFNIDVPF